jgi:hypothetical protein
MSERKSSSDRISLRNSEDNKPVNNDPQRRMELDRSRGSVRVSRREGSKILAGDTSTFHKSEDSTVEKPSG